jgi:competence protein ComEC
MEIDMECFYCNMYQNFLKSDVLIISNSGSAVSSSLEFLNKVQPEISLISIKNRNKINRPSQYILDRLKKINSKIYRTDEEGAIILQSNGNSLTKVNWK